MKGYVYVLTNPAMPGLVKIGRSKHAGGARARQLYKGDTGVPLPFDVFFECLFSDCIEGELSVHERLSHVRVNPDREFFRADPSIAATAVLDACCSGFDCTVRHADFVVCDGKMAEVADKFDLYPPEPFQAIEFFSDAAWVEAIAAYRESLPDLFEECDGAQAAGGTDRPAPQSIDGAEG